MVVYEKLTDPIIDITTSVEALLTGAFGALGGDQREGLKAVYSNAWGLHTLFMDVITSLGLENVARRDYLYDKFEVHVKPMEKNIALLLAHWDGPLTEEQVIALEFMRDTTACVRRHIAALWLHSQLKEQMVRVRRRPFTLAPLLEALDLPAADAKIQYQLPQAALIPKAVGDVRWAQHTLQILVDNALHATREGLIMLRTETRGIWLDIYVSDEGRGIPAEAQTRIFEPFFQVHDNPQHLGLGLTIAFLLTKLQGGTLVCESNLGYGSTFILSLPLAQ